MQLTMFSDLALRVLMYTHAAGDRLVTIDEITGAYKVSRAHLNKVVNALTRAGYLTAVRGRSGGVRLGKPAEQIGLGNVIRATEPDFALVECFATGNQCVITKCCKLQVVLMTHFRPSWRLSISTHWRRLLSGRAIFRFRLGAP